MNYFAHGMRFTGRPYFLAGTAVPDWLSVADRQVRLRDRQVRPFVDGSSSVQAELAAGVLQHLDDDRWFHRTPAFFETTEMIARMFRERLGPDEGFRPGFLGHIVTEMVLDGVLIGRQPSLLDAYYETIAKLDENQVEQAVNRMARRPTARLSPFIPRFHQEQFLRDYLEPKRLLYRVNQVMRRIKLNQLPGGCHETLKGAWTIVEGRVDRLLPEFFEPPRLRGAAAKTVG